MGISITRKERFYMACSQCKKEFFDRNDFENHSCFKDGKTFDPMAKIGDTGIYSSSVRHSGNHKDHSPSKNDVLANSSENTGISEVEDTKAVDLRLEAVKEITKMKQELVLGGIEAQTMTAEETRKAYAAFKEKSKEVENGEKSVEETAISSTVETTKRKRNANAK